MAAWRLATPPALRYKASRVPLYVGTNAVERTTSSGIANEEPVRSAVLSSMLENNHFIIVYFRTFGVNSVFLVQDGV